MLTYVGDYLCNMDNTNMINRKLLTELNIYIHTHIQTDRQTDRHTCNMDNTNVINRKLLTELNTYIHTYVRTYIHT